MHNFSVHLLECTKTFHYFPMGKEWMSAARKCSLWNQTTSIHLKVQVSFYYTFIYTVLTFTWGKLDCVPGFYAIEKVLLKLYTSRVQQNPTWNKARTCSIPAPLLHHCLLSAFVRQTATWMLPENLQQWKTRLVQIGFGGKPFRDTSVPRKKALLQQVHGFLF